MQCENTKCKKIVANPYSCNKCNFKFCSNSCMIDHYFDEHQLSNENSKITSMLPSQNLKKTNKKNSVNSAFIKSGEYLKEIKSDPYFKFENFEKVKMGKKMQVLGAGAFGDVYLVKNKLDGKFFAVKQMYKKRILETGVKLDIVRREIDIHSRLIHPNIIKLYSYHEDELAFYLILEYANSGTLFTTIRKSKGLEEKNAFNYFIQVATAINFIHENNLIHRDIKPENLLVDENNNIKLCDFGWCIELEIGNRTTFCGTIEYMAPEIIKEMPYDKSIDVWSLGILLYELIHGYSPFRADGDQEEEHTQIFKNIIKFKFKIDKPNLSKSCMDIITKLLSTDINCRIKTKDIFAHPWVTDFENDYLKNNKFESFNSNSVPVVEAVLNKNEGIKQPFSLNNKKENTNSLNLENNLRDKSADCKKSSKKNSVLEEHREKIQENLKSQKKYSLENALNNTQDFSDFSSLSKTESLFDKVLTQVTDKNKDKRKKTKMFYEQYDHGEIEKIIEKENKIVLKVEREEKQICPIPNQKKIKNFEMLNEIKEIDNNLNKHIDEQARKKDLIKNSKQELSKVLAYENIKKNNQSNQYNSLEENDEFKEYSKYYNTNLINYSNNNKSINPQSNNSIILNPKSYFQDEDLNKIQNDNLNISDDYSENIKKLKKNLKVDEKINYNDELYLNNNCKVRNTSKNPKNSVIVNPNKDKSSFSNGECAMDENNPNFLAAIELLEKAQENKKEMDIENKKSKNFWDRFSTFMNPFKCE